MFCKENEIERGKEKERGSERDREGYVRGEFNKIPDFFV